MKKIILILCIASIFCSCGVDKVYTPANYGSIKKYTSKPIYYDSIKSANYISLALNIGQHPQRNVQSDTKLISSLNIHQSKSFEKYNYYYGLGINYGNYKFKSSLNEIITNNEIKHFYTFNPKVGISYKKSNSTVEYEIIGLELNYHYENGSYPKKLNQITPTSTVRAINEKSLFSLNLFTELILKINKDNNIGIGLFSGSLIGLDEKKYNIVNSGGSSFGGFTLSYRFKKLTFSLVSEKAAREIRSINYAITHQF